MKVAQLIEALQKMPQDADVVTHANSHTTSASESVRVGLVSKAVVVGNWHEFAMMNWKGTSLRPSGESLVVYNWGDDRGKLIRQRHILEPKHTEQRLALVDVEERFRLEKVL